MFCVINYKIILFFNLNSFQKHYLHISFYILLLFYRLLRPRLQLKSLRLQLLQWTHFVETSVQNLLLKLNRQMFSLHQVHHLYLVWYLKSKPILNIRGAFKKSVPLFCVMTRESDRKVKRKPAGSWGKSLFFYMVAP